MPIPLLPRLNEENKITLTKRGTWRNDSQTTLGNLVTDLNLPILLLSQIYGQDR